MMNVSETVKTAYANPSAGKTLVVYFPNLGITVDPNTVYSESFKLSESIMDSSSIEFIGCNPSKMQVQIQNFGENVKGEAVQVSVYTEDTESEPVILFNGIVDTVTQQSNKQIKEIVAYDVLYTLGNTDVAQWYLDKFANDWTDGVTLADFRSALFTYLDLPVVSTTLVNDALEISKQYSPVNLKALDLIKYICQINGVFGIINRDNEFEFRAINVQETPVAVTYYKNIEYQEFTVKPVDKLTVRQSDQVEGVSVGSGTNTYIVQGNFFTLNLTGEELQTVANNLYPSISGVSYIPFRVTQVAYPWVECGDVVQYEIYDFEASQAQGEDVYTPKSFLILERYITGIQAFRDEYEAQGEEEQSVFITNINAQIDTVRDQLEQVSGKVNSIALKYTMLYNENAIDVADGNSKTIIKIQFSVSQPTQIRIDMEYLLHCITTELLTDELVTNTDLNITLQYYYDGVLVDSRMPKETYFDGEHILSTYYVVNVPDTERHKWRVDLECTGGSVHIDALKAQNTIVGLSTVIDDVSPDTSIVDAISVSWINTLGTQPIERSNIHEIIEEEA